MSNASNITTIRQDIDRINRLINESTQLMNSPVSTLASDMSGYLERNASKLAAPLWVNFKKLTSQGKKEAVIIGGAVLGTLYLGAKAIDATRDAVAHAKAQKQLKAYQQMLAVKQNMLIEEQQKLILRQSQDIDLLEEEREEITRTVSKLAHTITKIQEQTSKA